MDEKIKILNQLRKKARMAYLYLAFGLLAVLVTLLLFTPSFGAGVAVLVLGMYWFFQRKDIQDFRNQYREMITLHCIGKEMQAERYVAKNILSMEQVVHDACIPIVDSKGIVRSGVTGIYHGNPVCLTDISYTYILDKKNVLNISGCYVRVQWKKKAEPIIVLCADSVMPEVVMDRYYAEQSLKKYNFQHVPESVREHWYCYASEDPGDRFSSEFCESLTRLYRKSEGRIAIKMDGSNLYAFVRLRYLGVCEPEYKYPISKEEFEISLFPELKDILELG